MDDTLREGNVVKIVGVQGQPHLNGTFVRLLRQLPNGRWETQGYSDPAQEAALQPKNLTAMSPLTRQLFHYLAGNGHLGQRLAGAGNDPAQLHLEARSPAFACALHRACTLRVPSFTAQ